MGWLNAAPAKELIQKGQNNLNLGAVHRHDGRSTKAGAEPPGYTLKPRQGDRNNASSG